MTKRVRHPKPTPAQNAGRLIRKAADIIEDRGWVQDGIGNPARGLCMLGGMLYSETGGNFVRTSLKAHMAAVFLGNWLIEYTGSHTSIPTWNDEEGRTQLEVLTILRKAADDLDPQR